MKKILLFVLAMSLAAAQVWAQTNVVYSCDFENATERSQWVMNATANPQVKQNLTNFWNMGKTGHFAPTGQWGMYIGTSETATESGYSGSKTIENLSYRVLPQMAAGTYTVTFNWRGVCKTGQEGLYVLVVPATTNTYSGSTALSMPWFKSYVVPMTSDNVLHGASTWSVAKGSFTLASAGSYKLVLLFFAVKGDETVPAPMVDNIEILSSAACAAPENVSDTVVGTNVILKWQGSADNYDIRAYRYDTQKWQEKSVKGAAGANQSASISNLEEGAWTFFVRSRCGNNHSEWVKYETFVIHKGTRCIDYMDLNDHNCAYGKYSDTILTRGKVDYGYADSKSRHTLHMVVDEIDSRTAGTDGTYLVTKPADALASVRLGNWNSASEKEQITYSYSVTKENAVLRLQYALVTKYYAAAYPPSFVLSISYNGKPLAGERGAMNLYGDGTYAAADGWHKMGTGGSGAVRWKEWSMKTVNLKDYIGKKVTVTLFNSDCSTSVSSYYGYAYFTIDCADISPVEEIWDNESTKQSGRKMVRDGRLLIVRDGRMYDVMGGEVK